MKAIITRPMCVIGDNKDIIRFEPSTPNTPFVEISSIVYARLKRANAAKPFQEFVITNEILKQDIVSQEETHPYKATTTSKRSTQTTKKS
ncbi:hypothetical protein [Bartonella ancashensis]|uniref:Putative prophage protein n=1 Tax=Bartonella ancashensis TaxID=1318743 RepID=A0A0M4L5W4_9HYPH|nr:hypothetical protein [Bartonella ancashensis]ALE02883.1 putative prophage protein [Bartonella ancashensis]